MFLLMLFCLLYSYKTKMQEILQSINMNLSQHLRYERINKGAFFWPTNVNKKEAGSDFTTNQRVREVQLANSQPTTVVGWQ